MTNTDTAPASPRTSPPSSNRTGPIKAYGSHLGYVTALRYIILATCRMRSSACDTVSRL